MLLFLYYNFIRIHESLRMTPAMATGITDHLYDLDWLLDMIDEEWPKSNRPTKYRKRQSGGDKNDLQVEDRGVVLSVADSPQ